MSHWGAGFALARTLSACSSGGANLCRTLPTICVGAFRCELLAMGPVFRRRFGARRLQVLRCFGLGIMPKDVHYIDHALTAVEHEAVNVEEMSFLRLQTMADSDFPHGRRYYTKSGYFQVLGDDVIHLLIDALATIPSRSSEIELTYIGGAAGRVPPEETAFGNREASFVVNILSNWAEPADDAANIAWTRNLFARLRPAMVPGVYVNFMSGDEEERVPEAYRGRWERLRSIKTEFDPRNLFRLNQNIPPHRAPSRN